MLLDIGCGCVNTMRRAVERFDVNVIVIRRCPRNQHAPLRRALAPIDTNRSRQRCCKADDFAETPSTDCVDRSSSSTLGTRKRDNPSSGCFNIAFADGRMTVQE